MGRTALPSGVRRVGEDGRPVGRRVPHRPPALPHEGLPRRPVGLPGQRFRPDVTGTRPVRRPHGAAAGVPLAEARRDGVPHPAGAARLAGGVSRSDASRARVSLPSRSGYAAGSTDARPVLRNPGGRPRTVSGSR